MPKGVVTTYQPTFSVTSLCRQTGTVTFIDNIVVESYINNWSESTSEFVKSLLDDESFHVVAMTRVSKKLLVD
jgi:hypothetical protein